MKKLGKVQLSVLAALKQHGSWWPEGICGWGWDTPSNTRRILDSLVRAGYATVTKKRIARSTRHVYAPTKKSVVL